MCSSPRSAASRRRASRCSRDVTSSPDQASMSAFCQTGTNQYPTVSSRASCPGRASASARSMVVRALASPRSSWMNARSASVSASTARSPSSSAISTALRACCSAAATSPWRCVLQVSSFSSETRTAGSLQRSASACSNRTAAAVPSPAQRRARPRRTIAVARSTPGFRGGLRGLEEHERTPRVPGRRPVIGGEQKTWPFMVRVRPSLSWRGSCPMKSSRRGANRSRSDSGVGL